MNDKNTMLQTMLLIAVMVVGFFLIQRFFTGGGAGGAANLPARANYAAAMPAGVENAAPDVAHPFPKHETRTLGSLDPKAADKLQLEIDNTTAGINWVKLKDYPASVRKLSGPLELIRAEPGVLRPFATTAFEIGNAFGSKAIDVTTRTGGDFTWEFVEPKSPNEVRLQHTLYGAENKPALVITKIFRVTPGAYDVQIEHQVQNLTGIEMNVQIDQLGPTELANDSVQTDSRAYQAAAYLSGGKYIKGDEKFLGATALETPLNAIADLERRLSDKTADVTLKTARFAAGTTSMADLDAARKELRDLKKERDDKALEVTLGDFDGRDLKIWNAAVELRRQCDDLNTRQAELKAHGAPAAELEAVRKQAEDVDKQRREKEKEATAGDSNGRHFLVWTAASDRFFTAIVRPYSDPAKNQPLAWGPQANLTESVGPARVVYAGTKPYGPKTVGVQALYLQGEPLAVAAGATRVLPVSTYLGPKDSDLLKGSMSAAAGSAAYEHFLYHYGDVIQYSQGCYSYCFFGAISPLAGFILWLLNLVYMVVRNYGIAIMVLVLVVRLLLHPLTRYSQVNMATMQKKMAKLQPEIERVKKKYDKDRSRQQQELMAVYRENHVNPAGGIMGCLPMVIQMPIWIALYSGLAADIHLRHAMFIPGWINDLSAPDTIFTWTTGWKVPFIGIDMNGVGAIALNLLPILLGAVFFAQMRIQMKTMPKPADEQQAQTQKMSQYMFLLFPLFLYNAPSGLNLYIFASTVGGFFDTWLVRRHMKAKEAAEAAK